MFSANHFIEIAEGANVKINFTESTTNCLNCGKKAQIIDGEYEFVGNVLQIIRNSKATVSQLQKFLKVIENAKTNESSPEEVSEEIEKEVPELSKLTDIFPQKRSELYPFLALLVQIIVTVLTGLGVYAALSKSNAPSITTTNITNNIVNNQTTKIVKESLKIKVKKRVKRKPSVNAPCHCGSGIKRKKCHGK